MLKIFNQYAFTSSYNFQVMRFASKDIFHTFLPFYYMARIVGLGFFKFNVNGGAFVVDNRHKIGLAAAVIFWSLMTVLVIAAMFFVEELPFVANTESKFLSKIGFVELLLEILFGVILILYQYKYRHHIHRFLVNLNSFDEIVKKLKWRFNIIHNWMYFMTVIVYVSIVIIVALTCFSLAQSDLVTSAIGLVNTLLFTTVVSQFIIGIYTTRNRLKVLYDNVK